MRKIILEKKVNGYKLVIVELEGRENIYLMNEDNDIEISIAGVFESYEYIRNKTYSLISFEIQTKSFGSKTAFAIEKLIEKYQNAVNAVEAFDEALQELEFKEMK